MRSHRTIIALRPPREPIRPYFLNPEAPMHTWFRRSSILAGLAFSALVASATTAAAQEKVGAGFLGGASFSTLRDVDTAVEVRSTTGFGGGFYVAVPVAKSLIVEPELIYVNKGAGIESADVTLNLNYIEIPVLLRYQFTEDGGPFAYVGPYVGLNVKCNTSVDTVGVACKDQSVEANTTFGGTVGVGFQRGVWGFDIRYDYGFTDAIKDEKGKNSTLMVLLRAALN